MIKKKILLVEDNIMLAENYVRILKPEFEVDWADNADKAFSIMDDNPPDLLILDVLLSGHSIFSFLNELQSYSDTIKLPTIICSDLAANLSVEDLSQFGVKEILDKSKMLPNDILRKARRVINEDN